MPNSPAARKARLILHMDKDRVGMFSGAFFGLVVLIACLYWSYADVYEIVFRVGLTFVVAYVAAFFLVHIFQSVAGPELTPKRTIRPLGPMGMDDNSDAPDTSGDQRE
ncbi:MAG: hypothetical protein IT366_12390 [Candidatus Hydrogenedentes bacterium]|nr:hypothetical protein [Candidatus Hydrogenedentota bacterium]